MNNAEEIELDNALKLWRILDHLCDLAKGPMPEIDDIYMQSCTFFEGRYETLWNDYTFGCELESFFRERGWVVKP